MSKDIKPFSIYDLQEAFAQPGCAICRLLVRDVERALDSLLYEYALEPDMHEKLRASRGLCAQHASQLQTQRGGVLGIAVLQITVVEELLRQMNSVSAVGNGLARWRGRSAVGDRLQPQERCLICENLRLTEAEHIHTLVDFVEDETLRAAYQTSDGVCAPHFAQALKLANEGQARLLSAVQSEHWRRLQAELETFAERYDINHADETMGAEGDSWRRALALLAGDSRIFGLHPR